MEGKQVTIEEMNRVIAEFDGWEYVSGRFDKNKKYIDANGFEHLSGASLKANQFTYHENWNLLMPVVEKIEAMDDEIVKKIYTSINGKTFCLWNYFDAKGILRKDSYLNCPFNKRNSATTKIEAVHQGVYNFIIWHKTQNQ